MMNHETREGWLLAATSILAKQVFSPIGETVPTVKISIGFPSSGIRSAAIGECWKSTAAKDGISQIHITPKIDSPVKILDILAHELIHAIYPDSGHGKVFKRVALAIGLTGPMRSTVAGPELEKRLNELSKELGPLPHSALSPSKQVGGKKKQGTRMIKCACLSCGYVARTTKQWLESVGAPLCACNSKPMSFAESEAA